MLLTPGVTINPGDSVTRQTIYNLLANATGGVVYASDVSADVIMIASQSEAPDPSPGKLWWDQTDNLLKVYVDMLDGTTVSVWQAIGPDRFDVIMYATEPLPFGAAVQPSGTGKRHAQLPPDPLTLFNMGWRTAMWEAWKVVGFNNNGPSALHETVQSGTWFACAVDGYVWYYAPVNQHYSGQAKSAWGTGINAQYDSLISGISTITSPTGISEVRGGLVWTPWDGFVVQSHIHMVQETKAWKADWGMFLQGIWHGARRGRL